MAITISRHQRVLNVGVESGSPHYRPGAEAKLSVQVFRFLASRIERKIAAF